MFSQLPNISKVWLATCDDEGHKSLFIMGEWIAVRKNSVPKSL